MTSLPILVMLVLGVFLVPQGLALGALAGVSNISADQFLCLTSTPCVTITLTRAFTPPQEIYRTEPGVHMPVLVMLRSNSHYNGLSSECLFFFFALWPFDKLTNHLLHFRHLGRKPTTR